MSLKRSISKKFCKVANCLVKSSNAPVSSVSPTIVSFIVGSSIFYFIILLIIYIILYYIIVYYYCLLLLFIIIILYYNYVI